MQERVAIFIDGSNFYHSLKKTFYFDDNSIDFNLLVQRLVGSRLFTQAYYYNAPLDLARNKNTYWKQQRFFAELRRIPDFNVVMCRMKKTRKEDGTVEYVVKEDDIHLAVDMLSLAYEGGYDTAILVSGDGDFVPLVRKVQKLGKKVENAYFSATSSSLLKFSCNGSVNLDKLVAECVRKKI